MRKKTNFSIVFILINLLIFTGCADKRKTYDLEIEKRNLDLGTIEEGTVKTLDFLFRNTGKEPLKILLVNPTCGCLTLEKWDKEIKPGRTGKVTVSIDTQDMNGKNIRVVEVGTNVPGYEKVELAITADVFNPVYMPLKSTWLGEVTDTTQPLNGQFTIINNMESSFKINNVILPGDQTSYEIKTVEKEKVYEFLFTVKPPFKTGGTITETITLITGGDEERVHDFSYSYEVQTPIQVNPRKVEVDMEKLKEEPYERRINIKSNIPEPIGILDLKFSGTGIKYRTVALSEGKFYQIPLNIPQNFTFPEDEPVFYLSFRVDNDPSGETYIIPIQAR